jgi:hypothetical protein
MRAIPVFSTLLMAITVTIGGCVIAVEPLGKSGDKLSLGHTEAPAQPQAQQTTQDPTSIPGTTVREVHDEKLAHYYECRAGYKPLPMDDRPKLGHVDATDKGNLALQLGALAHAQDQYMDDHQKKEEEAYRAWKAKCADVLH